MTHLRESFLVIPITVCLGTHPRMSQTTIIPEKHQNGSCSKRYKAERYLYFHKVIVHVDSKGFFLYARRITLVINERMPAV